MDCIFCEIVAGRAESSKVYEDDQILAFMDIQPLREGQLLIIPKEHVDHFTDVPDEIGVRIFLQAQRIARIIKKEFNPERIGFVVHGYGVAHAHFIVVPQSNANDITSALMAGIEDDKITFSMKRVSMAARGDLDRVAKIISESEY